MSRMGPVMKRFFAILFSAFCMAAPQASASEPADLDYSQVTSRDAAEELARKGALFKILLFPAEFGGEEVAANVVYVPAGIPEIKDQLTGTLIRFYEEGSIDKLTVKPEYKGKSIVPSRILMRASHSTKEGKFEPIIEIW